MTGRTHLTLGVAAGLGIAAYFNANPLICLVAGMLGGLLPDIDHPQSMLSGWVPGSGLLGIFGVRHRGFTHSLLFLLLTILLYPTIDVQIMMRMGLEQSPYTALALYAGIATHILSDMLTPQGLRLLFPLRANFKAAPGFVLQVGKFFGVVELVVWLGALAGIGGALFLIANPHL